MATEQKLVKILLTLFIIIAVLVIIGMVIGNIGFWLILAILVILAVVFRKKIMKWIK